MDNKAPADFSSHDEWLSYVREQVPAAVRPYVLACGRTELFKRFYAVRKQKFPAEFALELERIQELFDPERTSALESLNNRIFARLTEFLFNQVQPGLAKSEAIVSASPQEQVQELVEHLSKKNPYFALWSGYKNNYAASLDAESWNEYLCRELGMESGDEVAFARAMAELDKLLGYFRDRNLALPRYSFERTWFLHYLCEPERMLQTRALLSTLTAEIEACTSA